MIDSREISVVIQGPVRSETADCMKSVRRVLPNAEIIFSTWKDENIDKLSFDKLVVSNPPPVYVQHIRSGHLNNLNRLIRSTKAGIAIADRPFVLKIRSDLLLDNNSFLKSFDTFLAPGPRQIVSRKIVVPLIYSRTAYRGFRTPFHLSDWAAFGLNEDIQNLYLKTEEVKDPAFTQYFLGREKESPYGPTLLCMAPEQYQILSVFRHFFHDVDMTDCSVVTPELSQASDEFIISNFIVAPYSDTGWRLPKYENSINEFKEGSAYFELWTKFVYESYYRKYCDSNYSPYNQKDELRFRCRDAYEAIFRLKKHIGHLFRAKRLSKRMEQIAIIPPIAAWAFSKIIISLFRNNATTNANKFKPFGRFK